MWLWFRDSTPQVPRSEYAVLNALFTDMGHTQRTTPFLLNRKTVSLPEPLSDSPPSDSLPLPDRDVLCHVLRDVAEVDTVVLDNFYAANERFYAFSRRFDSQFKYQLTTVEEGQRLVQESVLTNLLWVELSRPGFNSTGDIAIVYYGWESDNS